jgi:hypothetical protein
MNFSTFDIDNSWLPVTDFVSKPVDFGVLASKVKALLGAAVRGALPVGAPKNGPPSSGR